MTTEISRQDGQTFNRTDEDIHYLIALCMHNKSEALGNKSVCYIYCCPKASIIIPANVAPHV